MSSKRPAIAVSHPNDVKQPPSSLLPSIKIEIGNTTTTADNEVIIHEACNLPVTFLSGVEERRVYSVEETSPIVAALESLIRGEVPRNSILNEAIARVKAVLAAQNLSPFLSIQGRLLLEDIWKIIDSLQRFLLENNIQEDLQVLIHRTLEFWKLREFEGPAFESIRSYVESVNYLRELLVLFVTSSEFRYLMKHLLNTLRLLANFPSTSIRSSIIEPGNIQVQFPHKVQVNMMPDDKRMYIAEQFRSILHVMSKKAEYKHAVRNFFKYLEWQVTCTIPLLSQENKNILYQLLQLDENAKNILEEFTGSGSIDLLSQAMQRFAEYHRSNPQSQILLRDIRMFAFQAFRSPKESTSEQRMNELENIVQRMKNVFIPCGHIASQYFMQIVTCGQNIIDNFKTNTERFEISKTLNQFLFHLTINETGRFDYDLLVNGLKQMKQWIVPIISQQILLIPVPKIYGSNDKFEFTVDNLLFRGSEFLPENMDLELKNEGELNVMSLVTQFLRVTLMFRARNICTTFKDIQFYFRMKGFPRIEDYGLMDISLSGDGLTIEISWQIQMMLAGPLVISLKEAVCEIDQLEINIHDAKHEFLDKIGTSLFANKIKQLVASSMAKELVSQLQTLTLKLNQLLESKPMIQLRQALGEAIRGLINNSIHAPTDF